MRIGAGMLVPLQGAAAGCRCRVLIAGAAVRAARTLFLGTSLRPFGKESRSVKRTEM